MRFPIVLLVQSSIHTTLFSILREVMGAQSVSISDRLGVIYATMKLAALTH